MILIIINWVFANRFYNCPSVKLKRFAWISGTEHIRTNNEKGCRVPGVTQAVLLVLGVAESTLTAHSMRSGQWDILLQKHGQDLVVIPVSGQDDGGYVHGGGIFWVLDPLDKFLESKKKRFQVVYLWLRTITMMLKEQNWKNLNIEAVYPFLYLIHICLKHISNRKQNQIKLNRIKLNQIESSQISFGSIWFSSIQFDWIGLDSVQFNSNALFDQFICWLYYDTI